ncbi:MAG: glutamate synthase central domain-containing protein, partial [Pseudomonadota bacterium]|nr:glutamate synthase central domain-containing protein [Pseudomonadota bacterium]
WMAARHAALESDLFGDDLEKLWPLIEDGQSDSASFDNALELLVMGGYSLPHAMMMLIPEAWAGNPLMDNKRRAFYEYNAALMEPWDGPAAVAFTNGRQIGATLDRNGLRPARYYVTSDDRVMMASEMGVLPVAEEKIIEKWRLQPGKMLLIDLEAGRIISDDEIKARLSTAHPYEEWLARAQIKLEDLPAPEGQAHVSSSLTVLDQQKAFGYTQEDLKFLLAPMVANGEEGTGSMGTDTPISALSEKSKPLYTYFKQNFAQVTNPPIDPIREELVMSLVSFIGPRPNLLDLEGTSGLKRLEVSQPILSNDDLEKIRRISDIEDNDFRAVTLDMTWNIADGVAGLTARLDELCSQAEHAIAHSHENIIILSDRNISAERIAIPALLATAAVHHHLIRAGLRTQAGLVIETGEAREVHHFCCLAGYGAEAINPYLAFDTVDALRTRLRRELSREEA